MERKYKIFSASLSLTLAWTHEVQTEHSVIFCDIIQFTDQKQSCEINPGNGTKHSMTNNDKAKTHPELSGPRGKSMFFFKKIKSATY